MWEVLSTHFIFILYLFYRHFHFILILYLFHFILQQAVPISASEARSEKFRQALELAINYILMANVTVGYLIVDGQLNLSRSLSDNANIHYMVALHPRLSADTSAAILNNALLSGLFSFTVFRNFGTFAPYVTGNFFVSSDPTGSIYASRRPSASPVASPSSATATSSSSSQSKKTRMILNCSISCR